jgi:uncharacterized protein (TIGR04255 family)
MTSKAPLPRFSSPPVIETVLGVEFAPLEKWTVPYFGLLWNDIRDRFPRIEVKPPLDSQIEHFDQPRKPIGARFEWLTEPEVRCWFIDSEDRTLMQVQKNRLTYNWRKRDAGDEYPHYDETIRPAFQKLWEQFAAFVARERLGELDILQCEVTYVNHLEIGIGWNAAADMNKVVACWSGATNGEFLPPPENVAFDTSYRMPDNKGRLRVSLKPAVRSQDGIEILQFTLTARGSPAASNALSVLDWLDMGRDWVVRGFADLTSKQMHALWKRST